MNYIPDCADCPTPEDCKVKNDCQVLRQIRHANDCPKREDKIHCVHWWDGEECCNCKAPAMTEAARIANGMESGVSP